MKVYFVRHGLAQSNVDGIVYQDPNDDLTPQGYEQARFVAERFAKIPIDAIITSNYRRAKETASVIAKATGHELIETDVLREIRRTSALKDLRKGDPRMQAIIAEAEGHFEDENYKHTDEESFAELKLRAKMALEFIAAQEYESVAVVTHGGFLRVMIGYMMEGDKLKLETLRYLMEFFETRNTGITMCNYHTKPDPEAIWGPVAEPGHWHLLSWNDHAHLG